MTFDELNLLEPLQRALQAAGYCQPTPVQAQAIPLALAGRDLMVSSRTGSGKTAAFMLPALTRVATPPASTADAQPAPAPTHTPHRASPGGRFERPNRGTSAPMRRPRVLVLTPTRELALQLARAASDYGRYLPQLRVATVVGGVPYGAQLAALRGPLDIVVATPGRLIDHIDSGRVPLAGIEMLVLDEADRMLDMGFIDDIRRIADALPKQRQTVMVSATFGGAVGKLAAGLLREPQRIESDDPEQSHADIEQRLHWADDREHKNALLDHILTERSVDQALVFTSTQADADWLAERLYGMGHRVASLHGGMPQGRRNRVLAGLRSRQLRVLVATDVAARGIDVPTISHVINYGLPMNEEDYVHRIGRTGRAGRAGLAVTLAERRDSGMIHRIQRFTTQRIPAAVIEGLEPQRPEPRPAPVQRGAGPGRGFGRRGAAGGPGGASGRRATKTPGRAGSSA
jgi:superfamily II DNA/RNA helicase